MQRDREGQKMGTHYKVHNFKKKAFFHMNYASDGRVENMCCHESIACQETAMN